MQWNLTSAMEKELVSLFVNLVLSLCDHFYNSFYCNAQNNCTKFMLYFNYTGTLMVQLISQLAVLF